MEQTIVVQAQKGVWIEERFLHQAHLGERLQVVVEEGEIRILPATTELPRFPYEATSGEVQTALREAREEVIALYGGQAPPADQPYFGGVTWQEYQALSDEQRQTLWDKVYAEFDVAMPHSRTSGCPATCNRARIGAPCNLYLSSLTTCNLTRPAPAPPPNRQGISDFEFRNSDLTLDRGERE